MPQGLIPNQDADALFPPLAQRVEDVFPLDTPLPAADTFDIGLVLGGTVSAAAYTAGVLDFLVQALDAWTVAKNTNDPAAPVHKTIIRIAAGTSGGGISCVLLSRILGSAFPHCDAGTTPEQRALNPLYDTWVNQIDIRDLLQTSDLDGANAIHSVLCAARLDVVSQRMADYAGKPLGTPGTPLVRDYVEQWLPVVLTLTNLRGVPYSSDFRGTSNRKEYYTDHADHMRFKVDIRGTNPPAPAHVMPYEVAISATPANGVQPWSTIIHAARGTSAFPAGFPPQTITRDARHYLYRYAILETPGNATAVWLRPAWSYMIPIGATADTPYSFLCVDGGCFNNEPTEYARQWLAGVLGHNEQSGDKAHRAVVLVDPFADAPGLGLINDSGILGTAMGTLSSWTGGTRFETADLDLFTSEEVFSRFLVNPVRQAADGTALTGGDALATSCLGAFGGFLSRSFRDHDFFLGRRNCQQFLRKSFVLPQENSLFANWTANQKRRYLSADGFLPIIPLVGDEVNREIAQPGWPKNTFAPDSLHDLIDRRLQKLAALGALSITGEQGFLLSQAVNFIVSKLGDKGTAKIIDIISSGLRSAGLLD